MLFMQVCKFIPIYQNCTLNENTKIHIHFYCLKINIQYWILLFSTFVMVTSTHSSWTGCLSEIESFDTCFLGRAMSDSCHYQHPGSDENSFGYPIITAIKYPFIKRSQPTKDQPSRPTKAAVCRTAPSHTSKRPQYCCRSKYV